MYCARRNNVFVYLCSYNYKFGSGNHMKEKYTLTHTAHTQIRVARVARCHSHNVAVCQQKSAETKQKCEEKNK